MDTMNEAAISVLPEKSRVSPDWFTTNKTELLTLIEKRNESVYAKINRATRRNTERARLARKELKNAIFRAKSSWITKICDNLNRSIARDRGTKNFWDSVKVIKSILNKPSPSAPIMMKKEDGSKCTTSEENAEVFQNHFQKFYNRPQILIHRY